MKNLYKFSFLLSLLGIINMYPDGFRELLSSFKHSLQQVATVLPQTTSNALTKINDTTYLLHNITINLVTGNIVKQKNIDVIVNAANKAGILPQGVGGVAGAILSNLTEPGRIEFNLDLKKRYPSMIENAEKNVGTAFAGKIPATTPLGQQGFRYLINAVGPNCAAGEDINLVKNAYYSSLQEAEKLHATSIIFPRISAMIFACDPETINKMAINATLDYITKHQNTSLTSIYFIFYDQSAIDRKALEEYKKILTSQAA